MEAGESPERCPDQGDHALPAVLQVQEEVSPAIDSSGSLGEVEPRAAHSQVPAFKEEGKRVERSLVARLEPAMVDPKIHFDEVDASFQEACDLSGGIGPVANDKGRCMPDIGPG